MTTIIERSLPAIAVSLLCLIVLWAAPYVDKWLAKRTKERKR